MAVRYRNGATFGERRSGEEAHRQMHPEAHKGRGRPRSSLTAAVFPLENQWRTDSRLKVASDFRRDLAAMF